jgi:GT2 family glycosyltransferase
MICVIIVNYFCAQDTARAAASVCADMPECEIVVVDNSAHADEAQRLNALLPASVRRVFSAENVGFGRACNTGLAATCGDPVMFLNPDARVLSGCLNRLRQTLAERPKTGAVGPLALWHDSVPLQYPPMYSEVVTREIGAHLIRVFPRLGRPLLELRKFRQWRFWRSARPARQATLSGGALMLSRALVRRLGEVFDPQFFMYYEDDDLSLRIRALGLDLVVDPAARIVHPTRPFDSKLALLTQGRERYLAKHHRAGLRRCLLEWIARQPGAWEHAQTVDLGVLTAPPQLEVPANWVRGWMFEIALSPYWDWSLGMLGAGPQVALDENFWNSLPPRTYYARLSPDRAQLLPRALHYKWRCPHPASSVIA